MFLYPTYVIIQSYNCLPIAVNEWSESFFKRKGNTTSVILKSPVVYGRIVLLYFQQRDRDIEKSVKVGQIQNILKRYCHRVVE